MNRDFGMWEHMLLGALIISKLFLFGHDIIFEIKVSDKKHGISINRELSVP